MIMARKNSEQEFTRINGLDFVMPTFDWRQVGGDMNPGSYGGIIARADGTTIDMIEIQPVREFVGDGEAAEVGFPFWTREATYDMDDIRDNLKDARSFSGLDDVLPDLSPDQRTLAVAESLLGYGTNVEEGNHGWSGDIVTWPVVWWTGKPATFEEHDAGDADADFRREVLEEEDESEGNPSNPTVSRVSNPRNY